MCILRAKKARRARKNGDSNTSQRNFMICRCFEENRSIEIRDCENKDQTKLLKDANTKYDFEFLYHPRGLNQR